RPVAAVSGCRCNRKHIHILKKFNLIKPINEGGRPEYLELTENGQKILNKLKKDYRRDIET
ncbi:MAG: hypothetical protein ACC656_15490, partial [Candidatus Heimdallarchaeota archaeon]